LAATVSLTLAYPAIARLKGAAANGTCSEWGVAPTLPIVAEEGRSAHAQLGYDNARLCARFQVTDDSPRVNQTGECELPFKTGDAVEVQLGTNLRERAVRGPGIQEMAVGDVGIIFGNEGGTRSAIRHLWADRSHEVSINNDIPSGSRLHPNDWGRWTLE
jgi:hypothetical protein